MPVSAIARPASFSRQALADVIEPCVCELYDKSRPSWCVAVMRSCCPRIATVAQQHAGMVELGEEVFHMPVRIGYPKYDGAGWPMWDARTALRQCDGLCGMEGAVQKRRGFAGPPESRKPGRFRAMRSWFERIGAGWNVVLQTLFQLNTSTGPI